MSDFFPAAEPESPASRRAARYWFAGMISSISGILVALVLGIWGGVFGGPHILLSYAIFAIGIGLVVTLGLWDAARRALKT